MTSELAHALSRLGLESWNLLERYAELLSRGDREICRLLKSQLHVLEDARTRQGHLDFRRPTRRRVLHRENGTIELTTVE